jgi:hypothetical protein
MASFCEHGNDPSGCIKVKEFLKQLSDFWLLKEVSAYQLDPEEEANMSLRNFCMHLQDYTESQQEHTFL